MKRTCENCYKTKMGNKSQACPCRDCKRRPGLRDYHATPEERAKAQDMRGYIRIHLMIMNRAMRPWS